MLRTLVPGLALGLALTMIGPGVCVASAQQAGETTRITIRYEQESRQGTSRGSASGGYEYIERVLAVSDQGIEREYSYREEREIALADWHMPVTVIERADGSLQITNREELEARRDHFLAEAEIPREACGSWYFTWNAFQVDCDPDSVLETIRELRLQPQNLAEGALYGHEFAREPAPLSLLEDDGQRSIWGVKLAISPDAAREARAHDRFVVAEISQEPITMEEALRAEASAQVSGSIAVTLGADSNGRVQSREVVIEMTYDPADEEPEISRSVRTTLREPL